MPDARAVWMMPTKVMSWLAMASKRILSASGSPEVLCACRMDQAMVPWRASSGVAAMPAAVASDSRTSSLPPRR